MGMCLLTIPENFGTMRATCERTMSSPLTITDAYGYAVSGNEHLRILPFTVGQHSNRRRCHASRLANITV